MICRSSGASLSLSTITRAEGAWRELGSAACRSQKSIRCDKLRRVPKGNSLISEGLDMIGRYLPAWGRGFHREQPNTPTEPEDPATPPPLAIH